MSSSSSAHAPAPEASHGSSTTRDSAGSAGDAGAKAAHVPPQLLGLSTLASAPPDARPAGAAGGNNGPEDEQAGGHGRIVAAPRPAGGADAADAQARPASTDTAAAAGSAGGNGAQRLEEKGVEDLGWNSTEGARPIPVLHGMPNEDLWLLVRRFNKQAFRVRRVDVRDTALPGVSGGGDGGDGKDERGAAASAAPGKKRRRFGRKKRTRRIAALDLNVSPSEEFTPDKLRATLERVYVTVFVGLAAGAAHLARLRSWRERPRTALFLALYAAAWAANVLAPAFFALLILLVLSDAARTRLFPPAPLAAIDKSTGAPRAPPAGHLGSAQSLTGAAEAYRGEAAEQEASNLVGVLGSVAVSTAAGATRTKHREDSDVDDDDDQDEEDDDGLDAAAAKEDRAGDGKKGAADKDALDAMPSLASAVSKGAELKQAAEGEASAAGSGAPAPAPAKKDHTKEPVEKAVWRSLNPVLHALNEVADYWERLENALSATPPFSKWTPRYRLAGVLVPLMLGTSLLDPALVWRGTTFGIGLGLFGQPLFDRLRPEPLIALLDTRAPHWREQLEPRNNLLRGIPTNAQLALTLLRIGEANRAPLPPPPPQSAKPPPSAHQGATMAEHPDLPEEHRDEMAQHAAEQQRREERTAKEAAGEGGSGAPASKRKALFLGLVKGTVKIGVETLLGGNRVKASIGSLPAKVRLGVVQDPATAERRRIGDGPISFRARYRGKRGLIFISTQATSPCISFERVGLVSGKPKSSTTAIKDKLAGREEAAARDEQRADADATEALAAVEKGADDNVQQSALFSIAVDDIAQIRKVGGLSWASKLVVGWALGSEVADGLEIVDGEGNEYKLTAVNRRDEAFNRLVAIGKQQWELF